MSVASHPSACFDILAEHGSVCPSIDKTIPRSRAVGSMFGLAPTPRFTLYLQLCDPLPHKCSQVYYIEIVFQVDAVGVAILAVPACLRRGVRTASEVSVYRLENRERRRMGLVIEFDGR